MPVSRHRLTVLQWGAATCHPQLMLQHNVRADKISISCHAEA